MTAKQETLEVVEKAIDVVEETVETLERVPNLALNGTTRKQQIVILTSVAVVSASVGAGVAWFAANKVLKTKFDNMLEDEIAATKAFYAKVNKVEAGTESPKVMAEALGYSVPDEDDVIERPRTEVAFTKDDEAVEINVFTNNAAPINQEERRQRAASGLPYVLDEEEYLQGDRDFEQTSLTFYAGDGVLADMADNPIEDSDKVVGDVNLTRFGQGSTDPNTVYIRNETLEMEFEIARSIGDFAQEVHGLRHSETDDRIRRFRGRDD